MAADGEEVVVVVVVAEAVARVAAVAMVAVVMLLLLGVVFVVLVVAAAMAFFSTGITAATFHTSLNALALTVAAPRNAAMQCRDGVISHGGSPETMRMGVEHEPVAAAAVMVTMSPGGGR